MACDRNFFGCFTPVVTEAAKVRVMTSQRYACVPFLDTALKLSANESLHCTDFKMLRDRNFFRLLYPGRSFQSLNSDVTAKIF